MGQIFEDDEELPDKLQPGGSEFWKLCEDYYTNPEMWICMLTHDERHDFWCLINDEFETSFFSESFENWDKLIGEFEELVTKNNTRYSDFVSWIDKCPFDDGSQI